MATKTFRSHELSEAAERQMRQWAWDLETQQQLEKQRARTPKQLIHPYIAISRESGVDAGEIAKAVASETGLEGPRSRAARLHG